MKNILKMLFSRLPFIVIMILIQVVWVFIMFSRLTHLASWIGTAFSIFSFFMFLDVITSTDSPEYKIVWIVVIGVVPIIGGLMYWLWGNKRPAHRLNKRLHVAEKVLSPMIDQDEYVLDKIPDRLHQTASYISKVGGYPVYENTSVEYYKVGEEMYADLLEDLESAEKFIFMEYFIIKRGEMWDGIKDILIRKASQGLDVRLIYDDMGCIGVFPISEKKQLVDAGVKVNVFNKMRPVLSAIMNNRDHRKITVIDGSIGYTGGLNLADEYINVNSPYGHWKDTAVRLYGDAVWNFTCMFLNLWDAFNTGSSKKEEFRAKDGMEIESDGFIQPFADTPFDNEALSSNVYLEIIWQAKEYLYIFTPYLIIDFEMTSALCMAAKRGVDVRIVVPGIPDKKTVYQLTQTYFEELMEAGIKIYLYTPGFIHAKSYISDDMVAIVGTINMDYRSLYLHIECGTLMINSSAIKKIKEDYLEVFKVSKLLDYEDLSHGRIVRIYRAILRFLSPLF